MEGHNSPTIAYESGNENIAPPAYAIPQPDDGSTPYLHQNEYIEYPQFIPRRQLISQYAQQSPNDNTTYKQPLIQHPPQYNSQLLQQQILIIPPQPPHIANISYPSLDNKCNNNNNIICVPPHQDLFCLAFITFFFFPILGLLAMCKASEANRAHSRGDYELAEIYNRQCRRYMKWAIGFCIVIIVFAIAMNVFFA